MSVEEGEIRAVIRAIRPAGDYTARDLRVLTAEALERAHGRALDEVEARDVERVVSRWFSEMCMAEALDALEAEERAAQARSKPPA